MARLLAYTFEFRGEALSDGDELVLRARAPSGTIETRVARDGVSSRQVVDERAEEGMLQARLAFRGGGSFTASAAIDFGHGHRLYIETAEGRLGDSPDERLRHGTAVFRVAGGAGQFTGATGRVTSNFVLSDTGDLTDRQVGVVFLRPGTARAL